MPEVSLCPSFQASSFLLSARVSSATRVSVRFLVVHLRHDSFQRLNWVRELEKALDTGIMSSQSFFPLSSPPESPRLMPRRPSLDPEREILSTRGQRILSLLPSRLSSSALQDLEQNTAEPPTFLRRGSQLIGHSNARYEWYVPWR
jgi:hypothetical protein